MGLRNKRWHGAYARGCYQEKEIDELINPPGYRPSDFRRPYTKPSFLERIFDAFYWSAVKQDRDHKGYFMWLAKDGLDTRWYNAWRNHPEEPWARDITAKIRRRLEERDRHK